VNFWNGSDASAIQYMDLKFYVVTDLTNKFNFCQGNVFAECKIITW
jgi:hypothetical protein